MMLTGERNAETVMQAMGAGADDYMVKPFHPDALARAGVAADRAQRQDARNDLGNLGERQLRRAPPAIARNRPAPYRRPVPTPAPA